jgi:beta-galactosidase GanA
VDGKPFLAMAGELSNNSATSIEHMKSAWPKLVEAKVNTVLAGVSWAQLEPEEGKYDFTRVDGVIQGARSHNLRLVFLWFASWKNSLSSYPPGWVKRNFERFPRAQTSGGKSIELLSPLSDVNRDADARAFAALMRHIKEVDGRQHTVIMIQLENEVGMHGDSRDRSPAANKAFEGPVPKELMDYLQAHKDTLIPEFRQVWEAAGFKTSGTWEEVFGQSRVTDGIFMAWYYACYIGRVAEAGKAEYPLPMFTNAALYGLGRGPTPPSGGRPWDVVMDVWKAGGPQIDMLSPDSYSDSDFAAFCAKYTQSGNPLFVPENMGGADGAARVLYVFGRHDGIGWTVMGIEDPKLTHPDKDLIANFDLITQLAPLIAEHQGNGTMSAVILRTLNDPPQKIQLGDYTLEVSFFSLPRMFGVPAPKDPPPPAAAIFIMTGPDEYFVAGNGVKVTFSPNTPGPPLAGLETVEEGTFVNGRWVAGRSFAGDDSDEGQCLMMQRKGIQRVTVYRYR